MFHPKSFQIHYTRPKLPDVFHAIFYYELYTNEYRCIYYEAVLRKEIDVPELVMNDISVKDLEHRMRSIDWKDNNLIDSTRQEKDIAGTWQREETIEKIIDELQTLTASPDGMGIGNLLQFKFWIDTSLDYLIPDITTFRNRYEINQRFYFFDGEEQINIEEAYRFLCHRWREKQLNALKKQKNPVSATSMALKGSKEKSPKNKKKEKLDKQ